MLTEWRVMSGHPTTITNFVASAVERFGGVDILVNNAGRSGGGVTADLDDALWFDVINTNLNSVFLMNPGRAVGWRDAQQGLGEDHQHRIHRGKAGRGPGCALLGVQAWRGRLYQGTRKRARQDGSHG